MGRLQQQRVDQASALYTYLIPTSLLTGILTCSQSLRKDTFFEDQDTCIFFFFVFK